jgi:hypothetical protein
VQRGFERGHFSDAWARYIDGADASSPDTPLPCVTALHPLKNNDLSVTKGDLSPSPVLPKVTANTLKVKDCNAVTHGDPLPAQETSDDWREATL